MATDPPVRAPRIGQPVGGLRWFGLDGVEHTGGSLVDFDGDGQADYRLFDSDGNGLADRAISFGDSGVTGEGQMLGTPDFIAPEQIRNAQSADIRADVYSLGCTLYYLLAGRPPFQANSLYDIYQAHISRDADPLNIIFGGAILVSMVANVQLTRLRERGQR